MSNYSRERKFKSPNPVGAPILAVPQDHIPLNDACVGNAFIAVRCAQKSPLLPFSKEDMIKVRKRTVIAIDEHTTTTPQPASSPRGGLYHASRRVLTTSQQRQPLKNQCQHPTRCHVLPALVYSNCASAQYWSNIVPLTHQLVSRRTETRMPVSYSHMYSACLALGKSHPTVFFLQRTTSETAGGERKRRNINTHHAHAQPANCTYSSAVQ